MGIASWGEETKLLSGKKSYRAPEIESGSGEKEYGKMCDIWSLGVLLYYLCNGTDK